MIGITFFILLISCFLQVVVSDTLSLYHYSGTTFLELPRSIELQSNPIDLRFTANFFYHAPFVTLSESIRKSTSKWDFQIQSKRTIFRNGISRERLSWSTQQHVPSLYTSICDSSLLYISQKMCCVETVGKARMHNFLEEIIEFHSSALNLKFNLYSSGKIVFDPIASPIGDNERKGWLVQDKDAEDPAVNKQAESIELVIDAIRKTSLVRIENFEIDYLNDIPNPTRYAQMVYTLLRLENRIHEQSESNFHIAQDDYSIGFLAALKELLDSKQELSWELLYELSLREMTSKLLTYSVEYSILPYNHTVNQDIANHTFVAIGSAQNLVSVTPMDIWTSKFELDAIERLILDAPILLHEYPIEIFGAVLKHFPHKAVTQKLLNVLQTSDVKLREFAGSPLVALQRAKGFLVAIHRFGHFVADEAIVQVSNVEMSVIEAIRDQLQSNQEPIIFKYSTLDPERCPNVHNEDYIDVKKAYKKDNVIYGFIATNVYGLAPLVIPGDSLVYHQRTEHRFNVLARFNPALVNYNIAHLLENKYIEYKYWETYCPGIMPRVAFLPDLLPPNLDMTNGVPPDVFMDSLNKAFPNGWVAKGIWDYNSVGKLVTQDLNITELVETYRVSNFASFVEEKMKTLAGCEPIEDLNDVIKNHVHYMGWKIDSMLRIPHDVMVQEMIKIEEEQRVECNIGHCPRFLMLEDKGTKKKPKYIQDYYQTAIHTKFMECMEKVPEKLRGIPLTSDAAITPDGEVYFLETNPGGNSWLLSNDIESLKKHNQWMKEFPSLIRNKKSYYEGMSANEQMEYIHVMFSIWNITVERESPRFRFMKDRILDEEHVLPYAINDTRAINPTVPPVPRKRVHPEIRNALMNDAIAYFQSIDPTKLKGDKLHYVAALVNFMFYKEVHPDFYIQAYHLVERVRIQFREDFRQPLILKIEKFEKEYPLDTSKKIILNDDQKTALGQFIMNCMEDLIDLQTLDIPHEDLRIKLNKYFSLFNAQNISTSDLDTMLFKGYTLWSEDTFDSVVQMARSPIIFGNAVQGGYQLLQSLLSQFIDVMGAIYALERTGYRIQNFDPKDFYVKWIPKIRELYTMDIFDWENPSPNEFVNVAAVELIYTTTHILYHFSDYSLFKLNATVFEPEFTFLKKVVPYVVYGTQDVDLTGEVLDCLMLLSKEKDIEDLLFIGHDFIRSKQDLSTGGFPQGDDEVATPHPTHTAVTALVDHDYTQITCCNELGDNIDFETYRNINRFYGLMNSPHHYYRNEFIEESNKHFDYLDQTQNFTLPIEGLFNHTVFDHQYMKIRLELYRKKVLAQEEKRLEKEKRKLEKQKAVELNVNLQMSRISTLETEKVQIEQSIKKYITTIPTNDDERLNIELMRKILLDEYKKIEDEILSLKKSLNIVENKPTETEGQASEIKNEVIDNKDIADEDKEREDNEDSEDSEDNEDKGDHDEKDKEDGDKDESDDNSSLDKADILIENGNLRMKIEL